MSKTFDVNKAIIENYIFEGGDVTQLSEFVGQQVKLHSMNKLSGKVFNPLGFVSNIIDLQDNSIVAGVLTRTFSQVSGNAGLLDTEDGQTFGRVIDNNAEDVYYRDTEDFQDDMNSMSGSFVGSTLRQIANSAINKVSQGTPFADFGKPSRSILAHTLAYSKKLVEDNFEGTQTSMGDVYDDEQANEEQAFNIDPVGANALLYSHDISSLSSLDPIEVWGMIKDVKLGLYAQNIMTEKPQVARDYDYEKSMERVMNNDHISLNADNVADIIKDSAWYIRRTAPFKPKAKGHRLESSKTAYIRKVDEHLFDVLFNKGHVYGAKDMDSFYSLIIDDMVEQLGFLFENENITVGDFLKVNERVPEERGEDKGFYKERERVELKNDKYASLLQPNYKNNRKLFIKDRKKIHDTSFEDITAEGFYHESHDDPITVSKIYQGEVDGDFDPDNFLYMKFEDVRTNNFIFLKPYVDGVTDDTQASFEEVDYIGRTESIPKYMKTVGSLNFSFVVHASTPRELAFMYKKLEFIESLNYPMMNAPDFTVSKNPLIRFSLGDLYRDRGGYITSFSKSIGDGESAWETRKGAVVPKLIRCSVAIQKFHDEMPYYPKDYDWSERAGHTNFDFEYENVTNE